MVSMRYGIAIKLFVILLLSALCVIGSMVAMMQWSFDRGFLRYITHVELQAQDRTVAKLEEAYRQYGGWFAALNVENLWRETRFRAFYEAQSEFAPPPGPQSGPPPLGPSRTQHRGRPSLVIVDSANHVLVPPGLPQDMLEGYQFRPIRIDGRTVGQVGFPPSRLSESRDLRFVQQQTRTLLVIAGTILLVCALLAFPFSRQLVRPLQRLSQGTRELAAGNYANRIDVTSSDELGQLSRDFNHLAQALEKNEHARQQWMADIAHELRTPLSVARAQIEAFQDGIRKPDEAHLAQLHGQVLHLTHLVDDLRELAMADIGALNYRKENMHLFACLRSAVDGHRAAFDSAGLTLDLSLPAGPDLVYADAARLRQLFGNLIANSATYTNAGGKLAISVRYDDGRVVLAFADSEPGVPGEALPRLFDRLYRVDSSRNRRTGGTGLGLAICKSIVEAHGGEISASHSPLGGLQIQVALPLLPT
ncbi:MAG: HAMP domain-containing protein [Gammaproteobacteria bacterium]|nr:HAMP domain-containing protein [Gammaproteobacteria bacterium]